MIEIPLIHPYPNGTVGSKIHPYGQKLIMLYNEMGEVQKRGDPIYIKILRGGRKGSIAKFISDTENYTNNEFLRGDYQHQNYGGWRIIYNCYGIYGYFIWDGRKNKIMAALNPSFEGREKHAWLKNYNGPTIYKLFNKKQHAEKAIKRTPQKDIDGKILKIGDKVLYCNIRYGCGTELSRGVIKNFKGKTQRSYNDNLITHIYTVILNEDGKTESKIEHSKLMIKKE